MAHRRSILLVNKPFQIRFCLYVCSWLFVASLLYPWLIYQLFGFFLSYVKLDPLGPELSRIESVQSDILWLLAGLQILFMGVTFAMSVFVSHRIAGPLYKLKKFFVDSAKGDFAQRLQFRKGDHFQDLAQTYNEMMCGLQGRIGEAIAEIEAGRTEAGLELLRKLRG